MVTNSPHILCCWTLLQVLEFPAQFPDLNQRRTSNLSQSCQQGWTVLQCHILGFQGDQEVTFGGYGCRAWTCGLNVHTYVLKRCLALDGDRYEASPGLALLSPPCSSVELQGVYQFSIQTWSSGCHEGIFIKVNQENMTYNLQISRHIEAGLHCALAWTPKQNQSG